MRTMLEYIEKAKLQASPQNLEGLAKALGINRSGLYQYKHGLAYPSEDVMILLGIMAGVEPGQSIIDLMNIKAVAKSNKQQLRRVSIINEHLGVDDNEYKQSKSQENAIWNRR